MDLSKNIVLKENYTFLVMDARGAVSEAGETGLYNRDTRFLSRYEWSFSRPVRVLRSYAPELNRVDIHYSEFDGSFQAVGIERRVELEPLLMRDRLSVENTSLRPMSVEIVLRVGSDFVDMFEARGITGRAGNVRPARAIGAEQSRVEYEAADGLRFATTVRSNPAPEQNETGEMRFQLRLEPGGRRAITVGVELSTELEDGRMGPAYSVWQGVAESERTRLSSRDARHAEVFDRAVADMRGLMLFTDVGPIPAAGIPWFVAAFGRDSILTSLLLLSLWQEPAVGTLRYLGRHQATETDERRAAAPGKILHELRFGELSRTGEVPFGPYYGSVDSTPLYLILLDAVAELTGSRELVEELRPAWEAALDWLIEYGDPDGDGFLEYHGSPAGTGQGLPIQSWKDSDDSMTHADGTLANGPLAPSEVQGYAYAALQAGAGLCAAVGDTARAGELVVQAQRLAELFHAHFWLESRGTYALALDGQKRPLAVQNSNAGHLLWSGIVPESHAPRLRDTLFSEELWTGWGFRTLGSQELRYNPLSYHNGSVWPHDTALTAAGLARYGYADDARVIRNALYDLAATQPDHRLPELVGGYRRTLGPPVPYPVACRPQAWDAAALIFLAGLDSPEADRRPVRPSLTEASPLRES